MAKQLNIALFSPNKNPFSETFIQAHKNFLKGNVFYYYGLGEHIALENYPPLASQFYIYILKAIQKILKKDSAYVRVRLIKKSLQKHKIHAVLVEYGMHAHHILPAVEKANLPLVVHFHGHDATVKNILTEHDNYKEVFGYASKIIAVSRSMEEQLLALGCPRDKLVYNPNAAQSEFYEIQPKFTKKQFVSIGRFTNKKAPYYVILSFVEVLKKHPDAKLIMCGDGQLFEACSNLIRYHQLEDQIIMLGAVTSEKVMELFAESIGFIQHSITAANGDMEGMPISVLEASAAGLPVVATLHAGIIDVVEHEITGLLSQEHDVHGMSKNILRVLDDTAYAKTLGAAGKERIKKHFNFERHIDGIQQLLKQSVRP